MEYFSFLQYVDYALLFALGAIIGSFLNVVVFRFGSGKITKGRSKCMACGKTLRWYMLIPLLSFLFLKGRCAYCQTKLSKQYPVMELGTGMLVLFAGVQYDISFFVPHILPYIQFIVDAVALATLAVIAAYDLRHKIIPDQLSILLAVSGLLAVLLRTYVGDFPDLMPLFVSAPKWLDLAAAPLLAFPLAGIWYFSGGRAMGLGDAKLMWGVAWFLGFIGGLSAIIFAFWIASIPAIFLLVSKRGGLKTEVPFGPFIALATVLVYFFGWNMLNLSISLL
jgi:leader peptidase (prepilin peptidase)/N-methyltransferase